MSNPSAWINRSAGNVSGLEDWERVARVARRLEQNPAKQVRIPRRPGSVIDAVPRGWNVGSGHVGLEKLLMAGPGPQSVNRRQASYGPTYVNSICAQTGYLWSAVEADVHSFDGTITIHPGSTLSVQVKCRRKGFRESVSYPIKKHWRLNWEAADLPIFFVVVVVPENVGDWMQHEYEPERRTIHQTSAYWTRIDPLLSDQKSIKVTASNRLTVDTIELWRAMYREAISGFMGGGVP
jgi:hypothetical protein